jgi:hypothetical protein
VISNHILVSAGCVGSNHNFSILTIPIESSGIGLHTLHNLQDPEVCLGVFKILRHTAAATTQNQNKNLRPYLIVLGVCLPPHGYVYLCVPICFYLGVHTVYHLRLLTDV